MNGLLTMDKNELERAHKLRLVAAGKLSVQEASVELNISERHCFRLKAAFLREGDAALVNKNRGRPSNNGYPPEVRQEILDMIRRQYTDFGPTLLSEVLIERHDIYLDSETLRRWMLEAGLWVKVRKGRRHRRKRPRREAIGELVQFDGSHHAWFEDRGPTCCLFVFIDDASGRVFLYFAESENEQAALTIFLMYVKRYGIPEAIYLDRHSVYYSEDRETQFAKAAGKLGIKIIYARSPQGKGRVERSNRTHQDRLVRMLRLENISTIEAANAFLEAKYLDSHNNRHAKTADLADVHRDASIFDLDNIICHEEERSVNHDMTIQVHGMFYQLLACNDLLPVPRQRVVVRHWIDGSMHVFWRERELKIMECSVRPTSKPRMVQPPENHPWRRRPPIGKARKMTISELCRTKP